MPISADAIFALEEGSSLRFDHATTKVYCVAVADLKVDAVRVDVQVWDGAGEVFYGSTSVGFSEGDLEAYSSGESGEYSIFKDVVEQAVADYLDGLTENASVTFTVV